MLLEMAGITNDVPQVSSGVRRPHLARALFLPAVLTLVGVIVIMYSFSVDALATAGLEIPGPGLYVFALGMVILVLGLLFVGRALPDSKENGPA